VNVRETHPITSHIECSIDGKGVTEYDALPTTGGSTVLNIGILHLKATRMAQD